jgi:hypothetical protein
MRRLRVVLSISIAVLASLLPAAIALAGEPGAPFPK